MATVDVRVTDKQGKLIEMVRWAVPKTVEEGKEKLARDYGFEGYFQLDGIDLEWTAVLELGTEYLFVAIDQKAPSTSWWHNPEETLKRLKQEKEILDARRKKKIAAYRQRYKSKKL